MAGIGSLSASDVVAFAAREGNKMIEAQVNMKAKLFAALDKQQMKGKRSIINVVNGGLSSTSQVADFGALPTEAGVVPAQGFVDAVAYVSRLGLGRIALATLSGVDDSADLLDLHLQIAADDMARQIGRAVFGSSLSRPTNSASFSGANRVVQAGLVSGGNVTITAQFVGGLADFREGEAYIYEPEAGGGSPDHIAAPGVFTVLCTSVSIVSDNIVQVTFDTTVPGFDTTAIRDSLLTTCGGVVTGINGRVGNTANVAGATTDGFFLRGSRLLGVTGASRGASNNSPVALTDVTDPTAPLHGITAATAGWSGLTFAGGGTLAPTAEIFMGRSKLLQSRSGVAPTHLVMNPLMSVAYASAQIANGNAGTGFLGASIGTSVQARRNVDGKLDKYGKDGDMESGLSMFGRPVLLDDNCPVTTAYLINKDYLKVGEWKKLSAEDEGGSPLLLSRSTFSKEVQFSCIYNLVCRKRNAHAAITGLAI